MNAVLKLFLRSIHKILRLVPQCRLRNYQNVLPIGFLDLFSFQLINLLMPYVH